MNFVNFLTGNRILNISIIAWVVAQVLKVPLELIINKRLDFTRIWGGGGMPSSHSAFVTCCATAVGKLYSTSSPYFAIAVVLAIVVMYDASNVRRAAGEQAKILNYIMEHWSEQSPELFSKELKEFLGHTPIEVFFGALLGVIIGLLV